MNFGRAPKSILVMLCLVSIVAGCASQSTKQTSKRISKNVVRGSVQMRSPGARTAERPAVSPVKPQQQPEGSRLHVTILVDESLKGEDKVNVAAAWIGYAAARAEWVQENLSREDFKEMGYKRSFDEELSARKSLLEIWMELTESKSGLSDQYLDELVMVRKAGFLEEYVWQLLRSPDWTTKPDNLELKGFSNWLADKLPNHEVQTLSKIEITED